MFVRDKENHLTVFKSGPCGSGSALGHMLGYSTVNLIPSALLRCMHVLTVVHLLVKTCSVMMPHRDRTVNPRIGRQMLQLTVFEKYLTMTR